MPAKFSNKIPVPLPMGHVFRKRPNQWEGSAIFIAVSSAFLMEVYGREVQYPERLHGIQMFKPKAGYPSGILYRSMSSQMGIDGVIPWE